MPAGKYFAMNTTSKKKVLSNKSLTKQVRALKGTEGERKLTGELIYNAVTLTAGTADINYFAASGVFTSTAECPMVLHSLDVKMKFLCATAAGATVRLLLCFDEHYNGTGIVASDIFYTSTGSNSVAPYNQYNTRSVKTYKNKNLDQTPRCVVIRDTIISLNQNEPKVVSFKVPLFNRKVMDIGVADYLKPHPFMCLLADEANVTASVAYTLDYTTHKVS